MDWVSNILNMKSTRLLAFLSTIGGIFLTGGLTIYLFSENIFISLDWFKLITLSSAIEIPYYLALLLFSFITISTISTIKLNEENMETILTFIGIMNGVLSGVCVVAMYMSEPKMMIGQYLYYKAMAYIILFIIIIISSRVEDKRIANKTKKEETTTEP